MILVAVLLLLAGLVLAIWGVYFFWKRPVAAAIAVVMSFVLFGLGAALAGQFGGH